MVAETNAGRIFLFLATGLMFPDSCDCDPSPEHAGLDVSR